MLSFIHTWVILNTRKHEWEYTLSLEIFSMEQGCQSHTPSSPMEDLPGEWNCGIMATLFWIFIRNSRRGLIIYIGRKKNCMATKWKWLIDCVLAEKAQYPRVFNWSVNQPHVNVQSGAWKQGCPHILGEGGIDLSPGPLCLLSADQNDRWRQLRWVSRDIVRNSDPQAQEGCSGSLEVFSWPWKMWM